MLSVYGIKSCDSCRKATRYFAANNIDFRFHDFRADGLDLEMLERWMTRVDWTQLLNKQSLTWRKIPEVDRGDMNKERAFALMLENPTLVKRPVLEDANFVDVGFAEERFEQLKYGG